MKLWHRYLLTRFSGPFLLTFLLLFLFSLAIDLSLNGVPIQHPILPSLALHILSHLLQFLDLLLSFSFLAAILQALLSLQTHRELFALQMGGLTRAKLLLPYGIIATCLTLITYANFEWFLPFTEQQLLAIRPLSTPRLSSLTLQDGSTLTYRFYDPDSQTLTDLFWVQGPKIWSIQELQLHPHTPIGHHIEQFARNESGCLVLESRETLLPFPHLAISLTSLQMLSIPLEKRPLSTLLRNTQSLPLSFQKLTVPLLPFLILWISALFAFSEARSRSPLFPIGVSLLFFLFARALIEMTYLLAENHLLPSFAPLLFFLTLFPLEPIRMKLFHRFWRLFRYKIRKQTRFT